MHWVRVREREGGKEGEREGRRRGREGVKQSLPVLTWPVVALEVGDVRRRASLHAVVLPALEIRVPQRREVHHDAAVLRVLEHVVVPGAQAVGPRRFLLRGVAVEDVVVALRRTRGEERRREVRGKLDGQGSRMVGEERREGASIVRRFQDG